jgi:hypothetical protein
MAEVHDAFIGDASNFCKRVSLPMWAWSFLKNAKFHIGWQLGPVHAWHMPVCFVLLSMPHFLRLDVKS